LTQPTITAAQHRPAAALLAQKAKGSALIADPFSE
jgi:hypothetical protein